MEQVELEELVTASHEWEEFLDDLAGQIENLDPADVWKSREEIGRRLRTASIFAQQVRETVSPLMER